MSSYPNLVRDIIKEFLTIYKENRCLWDTQHMNYTSRKCRDEAYAKMLAKYRELEPDFSMADMKKKLDRMRLSYRREHKKVLLAESHGEEYHPQLWYYELLTFLNNVSDFSRNIMSHTTFDTSNASASNAEDSQQYEDIHCKQEDEYNTEYLENEYMGDVSAEQDSSGEESEDTSMVEIKKRKWKQLDPLTESLSTAIGFQLATLSRNQRTIAEKLISDIIFQARIEKLAYDSHIQLEDDD